MRQRRMLISNAGCLRAQWISRLLVLAMLFGAASTALAAEKAQATSASTGRTQLKPGMNFFKPAQDIELGQEAAKDAERQLPLLNNRQVDDYLNSVGQRLARTAPGHKYPYQFKAVNQKEINAFALPGGFLYVNRGTIEAAANEAELAGVMAHEIAHVSLRHGTNQLSKAMLAQAPLAVLGGFLGGGGSLVGQLTQLGIQVGFTSVFLKFSRTAETQADILGTQMLFDAGYNPQGMADFFNALQKESKGGGIEFFSSHPNPENRQKRIEQEIAKLGPKSGLQRDSDEFHEVQQLVRSLPAPPKPGKRDAADSGSGGIRRPTDPPSARFREYRQRDFVIRYPENWEVYESGSQVVFAPPGGVSERATAYGVMVNAVDLDDTRMSLEQATEHLVRNILQANPGMREIGHQSARISGRAALATQFSGPSPIAGERESDWLFTTRWGDSLFYGLFVVPESDYRAYQPTFQQMLESIRLR